jgi:uncharacterized protein YoxC
MRRHVFGFVLRRARSVVESVGREFTRPLQETEHETLGAVKALDRATDSIERHVEVIETLASSVGPLAESVDRLVDTVQELARILAPVEEAEQDVAHAEQSVHRVERLFGIHRHKPAEQTDAEHPEG